MWEIKKYKGPHTCVNPLMNQDHRQVDVRYVVTLVRPLVRAGLSISIAAIQAAVQQMTGTYSCTYRKAWLAKQKVIADLFGDWLRCTMCCRRSWMQYDEKIRAQLWFQDGLSATTNQFQRVFWSFGPSIEGFHSWRPVISIDGTYLYGKYWGSMLVAVEVDANNHYFHLREQRQLELAYGLPPGEGHTAGRLMCNIGSAQRDYCHHKRRLLGLGDGACPPSILCATIRQQLQL